MTYRARPAGPVTRKYFGKLYRFRSKMERAGAQGARGRKRA